VIEERSCATLANKGANLKPIEKLKTQNERPLRIQPKNNTGSGGGSVPDYRKPYRKHEEKPSQNATSNEIEVT
jgi:hypothetical protein